MELYLNVSVTTIQTQKRARKLFPTKVARKGGKGNKKTNKN